MILEPVKDFVRAPYCEVCQAAPGMTAEDALAAAGRLEDRAVRYYTEAAAKINAQPEVARALKLLAKKHNAHRDSLAAI